MSAYPNVDAWIRDYQEYLGAANVHICDGSEAEAQFLYGKMVAEGSLIKLNETTYPGCYLYPPKSTDVARSVHRTFMVGDPDNVGPTNNPMSPAKAYGEVWPMFRNVMAGKTMYVVPYANGPIGSPVTELGVQLTDSPLIPLNVRTLYTMGTMPLAHIRSGKPYVRGTHAVADIDAEKLYVLHLPETDEIWSINSASAGGNVILPKKGHGLRLGSIHARREGWMAEHMAIFGLDVHGKTYWFAAALPSACGKTTLATSFDRTLGDDLAGLFIGHDNRFHAVARERGFYGVAAGTNMKSNPVIAKMLNRNVLFMGTAVTPDGEPWWQGCGRPLPPGSKAWDGTPVEALGEKPASHPNARFTVSAKQCETISDLLDSPEGVPLSGIIIGGRRTKAAPLVYRARNWQHGVYMGATMVSESTAASVGKVGVPTYDPMAMGPFGGYNRADYYGHWLGMGRRVPTPPMIFHVNWFRTGDDGKWLWPGFDANRRVLEYMTRCVSGVARERESILGYVPAEGELDLTGLGIDQEGERALHNVDANVWLEEVANNEAELLKHGERLPAALWEQHKALKDRVRAALR